MKIIELSIQLRELAKEQNKLKQKKWINKNENSDWHHKIKKIS